MGWAREACRNENLVKGSNLIPPKTKTRIESRWIRLQRKKSDTGGKHVGRVEHRHSVDN